MDFLRNRVLRRFSILGRLGDIVLVAGVGLRIAQRQGWVTDDQVSQIGLAGMSDERPLAIGELALAAAAAIRLLRRRSRRRG